MKLIQSLFFIILLIAGVIFITELISVNDENFIKYTFDRTILSKESENSSSEIVDMVMINIPFTSADSSGMKVWVFFILVLTFGLVLGFMISLINIFTQRRQIMSQKYELKKLKSELDTLRNQNIDENLILSDDFDDDTKFTD
tara:strand:+ start:877 stop:1305 length:429 start_codon:yes stop_codon:yes gene_type:complete